MLYYIMTWFHRRIPISLEHSSCDQFEWNRVIWEDKGLIWLTFRSLAVRCETAEEIYSCMQIRTPRSQRQLRHWPRSCWKLSKSIGCCWEPLCRCRYQFWTLLVYSSSCPGSWAGPGSSCSCANLQHRNDAAPRRRWPKEKPASTDSSRSQIKFYRRCVQTSASENSGIVDHISRQPMIIWPDAAEDASDASSGCISSSCKCTLILSTFLSSCSASIKYDFYNIYIYNTINAKRYDFH